MTEQPFKTRDPAFWNEYYEAGTPPWQIEEACPPALAFVDSHPVEPCRILIPGCGLGHEAVAFAERGFSVVAMDLSEKVVALAKERVDSQLPITYRSGNICQAEPESLGYFDAIFEQTCYCAIDPRDRPAYVKATHSLLRKGGILFGVFYQADHGSYPPWPISKEEVRADFSPFFNIHTLERAQNSIESRAGKEWFAYFSKK